MIMNGKRKLDFQLYKVRANRNGYVYLIYTERSRGFPREWNIPLEYGGKLATTPPAMDTLRPIGIRSLCDSSAAQVTTAVEHIEKNGDPIQNDEHVFAGGV